MSNQYDSAGINCQKLNQFSNFNIFDFYYFDIWQWIIIIVQFDVA